MLLLQSPPQSIVLFSAQFGLPKWMIQLVMRGLLGLCLNFAFPAYSQSATQTPALDMDSSCDNKAVEQRQLDFWLGNWDVYDHGRKIAESKIERLPGSCSILESYFEPDGYTGKSINFFDATLYKWRQTWVDRVGTVSEFSGDLHEGAMRLEGETHLRDGKVILRKMTLSVTAQGQVRQYSERSADGGKSWSVAYDYFYTKQK